MGTIRKRGFYVFLASSLMFSATPVFADNPAPAEMKKAEVSIQAQSAMENASISKETALEKAKKAIDIPNGYVLRNVEFQSQWWSSNTPAWVFYWDHQGKEFGNIQVAIDANSGSVVNIEMNKNISPETAGYPPKVDAQKAKDIASEYIKAHFPDKLDFVRYDDASSLSKPPLSGVIQYPIVFKRVVKGILFDNNEIRVSVDGNGDIVNFSFRWSDNIQFPEVNAKLTQEQAAKIYADHFDLSLRFLRFYGPQPTGGQDYLAYMPDGLTGGPNFYPPSYIRATDGAFITPWGDEIKPEQIQKIRLADHKLGELQNGTDLNQQQAEAILKKYLPFPDQSVMLSAIYREQNAESPTSVWDFNWEVKNEGTSSGRSSASIDAKSGRILNYYNGDQIMYAKSAMPAADGPGEKYVPKLARGDGEKIANDLVRKLNPDIADTVYMLRSSVNPYDETNPRIYNYQFLVEKNGVSLENNGIGVSVDSKTGAITNYWFNLDNLKLPDTEPNVMNEETAKQAYLAMTDMRLTYVLPQEKPAIQPKGAQHSTTAMLVYQPLFKQTGEPIFLDAKTGTWMNRETGKPYITDGTITDIIGDPHEKEMRLLLRYNVFEVKDGKIFPNEEISRAEMIKMLMLVQNNGYQGWVDSNRKATFSDVSKESAYFNYIETAVDQKLLDADKGQLNPDEKIDREELAELIIRALGYNSLLTVPNLFTLDLKDVSSLKNPAAAQLITKLGILDTIEGYFEPEQHVTRSQGASAFYRYLTKRNFNGPIKY